MQFNQDSIDHPVYIKSYDNQNKQLTVIKRTNNDFEEIVVSNNCIIHFDSVTPNWNPKDHLGISADDVHKLTELNPEILLIGLGEEVKQLDIEILKPLFKNQIPFELMTTVNACRTYNILAGEHRNVIAALIL